MAVLVEEKTIVVRRTFLRANYPGSTRQFLRDARHAGKDIRYAIADRDLAAVSSRDAGRLTPIADRLEQLGATGSDFALLDTCNGAEPVVTWLDWHTDDLGVTGARLARGGSRRLIAPRGWVPADTLDAVYEEFLRNPDRFLSLGDKDGIGFWLDLETGREVRGILTTSRGGVGGYPTDLRQVAARELRRRGLEFEDPDWRPLSLTFQDQQGRDFPMSIYTEFRPRCLHVVLGVQDRVPPERRAAVADYLSRANWGLRCGQLLIDWSDGEVRFHASVLPADGTVTPAMVGEMIDAALATVQVFMDGLEQVIAGADAERAHSEAEGK